MARDNVEKILIKLWCDGDVVCEEPDGLAWCGDAAELQSGARGPASAAPNSTVIDGAHHEVPVRWRVVDLAGQRYMRGLDPLYRWRWASAASKL